jgi:nucleoside-diphosphate-sugar epimerase
MTQTRHSYAVMGATGHIGKVVTELLLQISNQVHGIGLLVRDANGDELVPTGAIQPHEFAVLK